MIDGSWKLSVAAYKLLKEPNSWYLPGMVICLDARKQGATSK